MLTKTRRSTWMALPADLAAALAHYHHDQGFAKECQSIRQLVAIGLRVLAEPPKPPRKAPRTPARKPER